MIEKHVPVLLNEVINSLDIKPHGIYVDLTLGRAGHSKEILKKLDTGKLICFDKDIEAINESNKKLADINSNYFLVKSDFRYLKKELNKLGIEKVDGILADLGVSSPQLDNKSRGFSYSQDTVLDMRMDLDNKLSASDIINHYSEEKIVDILYKNADVKLAKLIAKAIVENRPINTTFELNDLLKKVLPAKIVRQKNPSKAVFQALRIEVNDELGALKALLEQIDSVLNVDGKLAIITFHSKEDAIVKNYFQQLNYYDPVLKKIPIQINKKWKQKTVFPSEDEITNNKRARSAKLRIITRLE
ncbi:16S rRNA (cytosine(1402)-N(4))-methyltransferase RsmH [Mycoplasma phocoeninasale]|uniref:Ribosomal RNA small subunit methyltransferase H n=1 Tax=Mycoplasma phocoeninasale TaxID=2726117 RepID=A0A858U7L2_9MOLU|nr:16S rRNA (cytosine(1402)-N(4))-methyltransferase RsmH [Mycoplasma phocoeninasale]QJG66716.1 16S rRNA (cytosine(1402)-N(4))-methyltransferase RsmH [Mycoplasma phocoeninasale]